MNDLLTVERAAKYWSAKILFLDQIHEIVDINFLQNYVVLREMERPRITRWPDISQCKLQLRTVDDLTTTEIEELSMLLYGDQNGPIRILWVYNWSKRKKELLNPSMTKKIADFLRKKKVDIDNAINDGWAVKEK